MPEQFTKGYALLVGVGADLPVTVKDATALRELFVDPQRAAYPTTQVQLLTEAQADSRGILAALERLIEMTKKDDTVIIYFSGHGLRRRENKDHDTAEYYLVTYGGTKISGADFSEKIEKIQARKLLVLLDCCHAGGIPQIKGVEGAMEKSPMPPEFLDKLRAGSGRIVLASSHEDEVSYILEQEQASLFTKCLLEVLSGKGEKREDGYVRVFQMLTYLFDEVPKGTPNGEPQHPFLNSIRGLSENFAICFSPGAAQKSPEKPAAPPSAGRRFQREQEEQRLKLLNLERIGKLTVIEVLTKKISYLEEKLNKEERFETKTALEDARHELRRFQRELEEIECQITEIHSKRN